MMKSKNKNLSFYLAKSKEVFKTSFSRSCRYPSCPYCFDLVNLAALTVGGKTN